MNQHNVATRHCVFPDRLDQRIIGDHVQLVRQYQASVLLQTKPQRFELRIGHCADPNADLRACINPRCHQGMRQRLCVWNKQQKQTSIGWRHRS